MITDLKPWFVLIPVVGVGFGWFLNECSQWFRVRREDKKALNRILYQLLLVYDLLIKLNPDNLDKSLKKVYAKIPQFSPEMITDEVVSMITSWLIAAQMKRIFEKDLVELRASFAAAIDELSKIYPLLAFDLSSSVSIGATFEVMENMFADMEEKLAPGLPKSEELPQFIALMKPAIIEKSSKDIRKDILYLSFKISLRSRYRTGRTLAHLNRGFNDDSLDDAAQALTKTLSKLLGQQSPALVR